MIRSQPVCSRKRVAEIVALVSPCIPLSGYETGCGRSIGSPDRSQPHEVLYVCRRLGAPQQAVFAE